jgi:tetratricopeptide (TPR) repeat protein/predicted amidohydrolase
MTKEMTNSIQTDISRAESLFKSRKNKEALELLDKIKKHDGLSSENQLACMLLESRIKIKLADLKSALVLTEQALQMALEVKNLLRTVESYATKAEILWRLGEFDKGLTAIEEGERLLEETRSDEAGEEDQQLTRRKADLLCNAGVIHWYKGDLDRAIKYHQLSLKIMEKLGDVSGMAYVHNNMGLVYWAKSDLARAIECYLRSLLISEEVGDRRNMAASLNNLGNVYSMKGKLDEALEFYQRGLAIKEELGLKRDIGSSLTNIGSVYRLKGELDLALDYYQRGLVISEELDDKPNIALAILNSGDIHMVRGELGQAMEHFQRALELYKELGLKQMVALSLGNVADAYWKKGNIEQALEHYQQSLKIHEGMNNAPYVAVDLLNLLWIAVEKEDSSSAEQYLNKLEQINERTENKVINQRYRVAKALWLKSSKRPRREIEAVKILEEVIKEEVGDYMLAVTAMIHLCDLLLGELKDTGEEEIFNEIKELTNQLLEIAERQSSHSLLAQTYLLQSKLALIDLDMGQSKKLLRQAQSIAEEKGLIRLARAVAQERDSLQSQLKKLDTLIEQEPSKKEMIDLTNIDALLEQMIQKTVTSVMEERAISGGKTPKRYKLIHQDCLKDTSKSEKSTFRVGIAQIGLSKAGDIIHEFYEERGPGLFAFREEIVETVRAKIKNCVEDASEKAVDVLVFPELTIDLSYRQILEDLMGFSKTYKMMLIPGSYHDQEQKENLCVVISPSGVLWKQAKHIPAIIHFKGARMTEGIAGHAFPRETVVCCTEFGRIAIVICRDFLDMDLRVALKNADPSVDLIINPAFTPVTDDFKAAHFDARRSIYAYCFFANVAEFGGSFIYSPEKESVIRNIPAGGEGLIYKEVDLFKLRSERKRWEEERAKSRPFIQSTR